MKVPENAGEAISFPLTSDIVRRADNIRPYSGIRLSFTAVLFSAWLFAMEAQLS